MTHFAKQLIAIVIVGFLGGLPGARGDADSKQIEVSSRQDAKDRKDAKTEISVAGATLV